MNERIKELCEQAIVYANDSTKDFTGDEPVVWMDYYTQKFAELIVWECFLIGAKYIQSNDDVSKFEKHLKRTFRS